MSFGRLILFSLLLSYLGAQRVHEIGHWLLFQIFGRGPAMSFTGLIQLWETTPQNPENWVLYTDPITNEHGWLYLASLPQTSAEWAAILAAGQIAQLLVVVVSLIAVYFSKKPQIKSVGLLLAIINSLGQSLYHLRKLLLLLLGSMVGGGDEYFLAYYLEIPMYVITISLLLSYVIGLYLSVRIIETWRVRAKWIAAVFLVVVPVGILLMLVDNLIRLEVASGNLFFQPIIGFSFPVLLVDFVTIVVLVLAFKKWANTFAQI